MFPVIYVSNPNTENFYCPQNKISKVTLHDPYGFIIRVNQGTGVHSPYISLRHYNSWTFSCQVAWSSKALFYARENVFSVFPRWRNKANCPQH
jgi:hypothetical protein